jgi:small conductance mechanosensitive channel
MAFIAQTPLVPIDVGLISDDFDIRAITTADLVVAGIALVAGMVLAYLAKRALRRVLNGIDNMPILAGDVIARIVSYAILTLAVSVALEALGVSFGLIGSVLLLIVVLVVLAARPLLQDLGAGLIIQLRRPFHVGDQVAIEGVEATVEEVSARTVRTVTVDGRRVHFPNRAVLAGAITNLTSEGSRLTTFVVGVAYHTDLDRAVDVIVEAIESVPAVFADPPPMAFVQNFADSTIEIACRFWHAPEIQAEWAARDEAMRAVKRSFNEHGITIAFPQRVLWSQPTSP